MACNPILTYSNDCGKTTVAGIAQLYLIGFNDLKSISGTTEVYSLGVNDMVNQIQLNSGTTKFVKIGILPKAVSIKNSYAYDATKGVADINEELVLPVANVSTDSRKLVKSVSNRPVTALVKFSTGVWVALGLNGQLLVTAAEGNVNGTDNGYTITFSGVGDDFTPLVDPTIIPALIA